jgi:hypothetical protein
MFCVARRIFGGTEGVGSRFNILLSRTHFRRYRGRQVMFSSFSLPNSFSAVLTASGFVIMSCAPRLIFGGTGGVVSRISCFALQNAFRRYRGRRVPFSCFALLDSFSAVPRASGLVFMFCALGLIFGGTGGVGSRFHVLRSQTHFRRYRGRPIPFLRFSFPDMFSTISRALGPVCMFCAPGHVFGGTEGVRSRFHVLRSRTHFRRYQGLQVLF